MQNYLNPRSKRKQKAKARSLAKSMSTTKVLDYASNLKLYGLTSEEITASLARTKRGRVEPDKLQKEHELRAPYTATTKGAR